MATVASVADPSTDLIHKLSLDSQSKTHDVPEATKPFGIRGPEVPSRPVPSSDRSRTPVMPTFVDPNLCYAANGFAPAYYYGANELDEYPRYLSPGLDMSPHGYGDMYNGYTYATYGAYSHGSAVPIMGHNGQLYSTLPYQYPSAYYQPNAHAYPTNTSTKPSQPEVFTTMTENPPLSSDKTKPSSDGIRNANTGHGSLPSKPVQKNMATGSYNRGSMPGVVPTSFQDQRFGYNGIPSPAHRMYTSARSDVQHQHQTASGISTNSLHAGGLIIPRNQNVHYPFFVDSHPQGLVSGFGLPSPGYTRTHQQNKMYEQYASTPRSRQPFGPLNGLQSNGRGWLRADKCNVRGQGVGFYGYGNENMEILNESNRGPRSGRFKSSQKSLGPNVVIAVKGQSLPSVGVDEESAIPDKDQYNREDFQENYADVKFFVIKSYSEDDVHKSIKYGVWASTPNGNKKLDDAYKEAQGKANRCPIYLFFSVNTSGQFVGVAEMVGPVDFNKTVTYWQQDKWNGCFPVKWHIVKDVPNIALRHIILENNEGKPVTNSRDTQEVRLEQGNQMLKLFKDHISKTSVLEDFEFYENREKIIQDRRVRLQFQKQIWDEKVAPALATININDAADPEQKIQKIWEPVSVGTKDTAK